MTLVVNSSGGGAESILGERTGDRDQTAGEKAGRASEPPEAHSQIQHKGHFSTRNNSSFYESYDALTRNLRNLNKVTKWIH